MGSVFGGSDEPSGSDYLKEIELSEADSTNADDLLQHFRRQVLLGCLPYKP